MAIHTYYYTTEMIDLATIESVLKEKLADKYEYKASKAGNMVSKMVTGTVKDTLCVSKNAYHRTVVSLEETKENTNIYFTEDELAGWLSFLYSNCGFIGMGIIKLIYGNGDGFYDEVQNTIKENFDVKEGKVDIGLGQLFKKK